MTQISFIYFIRLLRYSTGFYSVQYVFFYYVTLNRKNIMKKFGSGELKSQLSLNCCLLYIKRASLVAQMLKCLSAVQETWVRSLGWEDPLEKEMAVHSSTLAWKISWMEEPGRLQSMASQRVRHD